YEGVHDDSTSPVWNRRPAAVACPALLPLRRPVVPGPRRRIAHLAHLNARDTTLVYASRAPQADIARLKARMGWDTPRYTITDSFDADFGVDEWHGHNAFIRDGDRVFRTYFINNGGDEAMGTTSSYLDMTALGRQETWEESPKGYPRAHRTNGGTGTRVTSPTPRR